MAAKHRFPGRRSKIGRCRVSADYLEDRQLDFDTDAASRIERYACHYSDFRRVAGDSDSDKVNIPSQVPNDACSRAY